MVQIEKQQQQQQQGRRRKKGRPTKAADLDEVAAPSVELTAAERDVRRSLRRRSFRYNIIDYDEDYEVEDGFGDDVDEEERKEKKVKLVTKLSGAAVGGGGAGGVRVRPTSGSDSDSEVEEESERVVKKRRVNGRSSSIKDDDDDDDNDNDNEDGNGVDVDVEGRDAKGGRTKIDDSNAPGTPGKENDDNVDNEGPTPLPDKKQLELILDKLQKKDTYGVYSEPVDPEELPDYHEVIEHPMDFSTVRKKLSDGCYSTLEEFESDVFLISSNAMQYNAPDTVYHKQARAIREQAEKKFRRVRVRIERLEPISEQKSEPNSEQKSEPKFEAKPEQRERSGSIVKKQLKKQLWSGMQEPVGSDFSCGATLATEDVHNGCGEDVAANHERPSSHDEPIERAPSLAEPIIEKAEDPQSGKGALPKFGRRLFVVDENRRATYNISNLTVERPESVFTTFENDKKQLIPVGVSGEYAYARSLARFAANLGPSAWRIASKRIEQLLPPGFKYGRGWIGEFEPISTALLFVSQHKDPFHLRSLNAVDSSKHSKILEGQASVSSHLLNQPTLDGKFPKSPIINVSAPQHHMPLQHASGVPSNRVPKRVESQFSPSNDEKSWNAPCPETAGVRRMESNPQAISDHKKDIVPQRQLPRQFEVGGRSAELCSPSATNQNLGKISQKQHPMDILASRPVVSVPMGKNQLQSLPFGHSEGHPMDIPASRPVVSVPMGKSHLQSLPFEQAESGPMDNPASRPVVPVPMVKNHLQSLPFRQAEGNGHALEALANGKAVNKFTDSNRSSTSPGTVSLPQRQDQSLSDPVLVMKMLTEKAQRQQNGSVHPHSPSQPRSSAPSPRGGSGGNAAAAAANVWMSVGAQNPFSNRSHMSSDSLYNGTRVFYPQAMQSRADCPASGTLQFRPEKDGLPFQAFAPQPIRPSNQAPMGFPPHMATNDLSRFQAQTPWQGLSPHTEQKQKQKQKQDSLPPDLNVAFQSSVDSQQPDLALQL